MLIRLNLAAQLPSGRRGRRSLLAGVLALSVSSCAQSPRQIGSQEATAPARDRPSVIATSTVLCDLTQQIAGDTVNLTCLLDYGQDPHIYKPSPSDRAAIDTANLVLYGGYQFEPAIIGMLKATPNPSPKVAVYEAAVPNPILSEGHEPGHEHEGPTAEAAGLQPDPHVWQTAKNSGAIATVLAAQLGQVVPANAQKYAEKATDLKIQFDQLDRWIRQQTATVPPANRTLVTTHDAFRYFANAYGFKVGGVLTGLSTAAKPSAATLTALVEEIKSNQVPAVFAEATTNPKLIETVARDAGVTVVQERLYDAGPGGPGTNSPTVQAMLVTNTCTLVNALGGTCDAGTAPL